MFGLSGLILLAAFGWVVTRVIQGLAGDQRNNRLDPPGSAPPLNPGERQQRSVTEELGARDRSNLPAREPAPLTRDEQIAALRRRYVADEITVEEYEAELDRLLKLN